MGALEDAREAASLPVGARAGASLDVYGVAQLISVDAGAGRATVSYRGSQPMDLPYNLAGTYAGVSTVDVLCNPLEGGRAVYVLGPRGALAGAPELPDAPTGEVTATALILPTWSGTWRTTRSAWDRWNTTRYGGRSDLYQGDAYGSGALKGLAVYGDQVVNLGAASIVSATVSLVRSNGTGVPAVQGSPHGTAYPAGPPSSSGATSSGVGAVSLDSTIAEALRTGAAKGLALVGAAYVGVYGTSRADGMALNITYTRPA